MGKTKNERIHNSYYYCYQNVHGRQVTSSSKLESPCSLLGKRGVISVASAGSLSLSSDCSKSSDSSVSSSSSTSAVSSSVSCAVLHKPHEYIKKLHNYFMFFTIRKSHPYYTYLSRLSKTMFCNIYCAYSYWNRRPFSGY